MIEVKYVSIKEMPSHGFAVNDRMEFSKTAGLLFEVAKIVAMGSIPDGEDSSGRQIHRGPTVEEIVTKSVTVVEALLEACRAKQWSAEKGTIEEMYRETPRTGF